ncbi:hypothetical protein, partial [Deminuibacter soli]
MRPFNRIIALMAFCILFVAELHAQAPRVPARKRLAGANNELVKNASLVIADDVYYQSNLTQIADTPYAVNNAVWFGINEQTNTYTAAAFTATIQTKITLEVAPQHSDFINRTFTIDYKPDGNYNQHKSMVFHGAHKVTVEILDITINGAPAAAPQLNMLELGVEMTVFPSFKFAYNDVNSTVRAVNMAPDNTNSDELKLSWPTVLPADEYDVEWAYVDSTALARYKNPATQLYDPALVFRNNATRITTADLTYNVPLLYDNGGVVFARVRAAKKLGAKGRMESAWSTDFVPMASTAYAFAGHERTMNWQSNISFAEDGKRKAVIQYFDGSLRSRQTVTKDNVENKTIVAETFYNSQGQPAIQVMPAPTLNNIIGYSRMFNVNVSGTEYDKLQYDSLTNPAAYCSAVAPQMHTAKGAALYYSGNNTALNDGLNKFIPDANGYAFTETQYTPDNTGRISRQGGVGSVFRLGTGHETQYYYGSPSQEELDALFGTEVGDKSHYFKNMVRDANGQYSVSYVDMHGRTIATALAGGVPAGTKLNQLPNYSADAITEVITDNVNPSIRNASIVNSKSLLVSMAGTHHFVYHLDPSWMNMADCNGNNIKYDCLYDLTITITDDCNNQKLNGPYIKTFSNFNAPNFPVNNPATAGIDLSFDIDLQPGNYEITKTLSPSKQAADYYRDNVFLLNNTCKTLETIKKEQRTIQHIGENCDVPVLPEHSQLDDIKMSMLLDMTAPSGQYADLDKATSKYSVFYDDGNGDNGKLLPYQRTDLVYLDENGYEDRIYDENLGIYLKPQQLTPAQFSAQFKASWANTLLLLHPEYCRLKNAVMHEASMQWDVDFGATATYADAVAKGYLNPTGNMSALPFSRYNPATTIDPLLRESSDFKNKLENSLLHYGANDFTLWSTAAATTLCDESNADCYNLYKDHMQPFSSLSCPGDLDMQWRKFRDAYLGIKNTLYLDAGMCGSTPKSAELIRDGFMPNFGDPSTALTDNQMDFLNQGYQNAGSITSTINGKMADNYKSNCDSYKDQWLKQLGSCVEYSEADKANIVALLAQVCVEGADETHPFGSSSVKPGSANVYKSFADVLNSYNSQHGYPQNTANRIYCNSEVITTPLPYDKQQAMSNDIALAKPSDCQCSAILELKNNYDVVAQGTFADYLKEVMHIDMSATDLDELLNMCGPNAKGCKYLTHPIALPPAFQCNVGSTCATCFEVKQLDAQYRQIYGSYLPAADESTDQQIQNNRLYASYLNNRLGYSLLAADYLAFLANCVPGSYNNIPDPNTDNPYVSRIYSADGDGASTTRTINSAVVTDGDNGFLLAGTTSFTDVSGVTPKLVPVGGVLIKTNAKGEWLWSKTLNGGSSFSKIRKVPGGYIVIGSTTAPWNAPDNGQPANLGGPVTLERMAPPAPDAGPGGVSTKSRVLVTKFDTNGVIVWSKAIGWNTANGELGTDIIPVGDNFAFTGQYNFAGG